MTTSTGGGDEKANEAARAYGASIHWNDKNINMVAGDFLAGVEWERARHADREKKMLGLLEKVPKMFCRCMSTFEPQQKWLADLEELRK